MNLTASTRHKSVDILNDSQATGPKDTRCMLIYQLKMPASSRWSYELIQQGRFNDMQSNSA